ncbi:MAG: IS4 family transposase [Alphaproteobacteria bacterium]|nr:IS4 family transposase [Alphaproteobacteria bacterium]
MARPDRSLVDVLLANLDRPEEVRDKARALGVVRRQGKIDAYALLVVVVLGIATRGPTAIAQLGHVLATVTGVRLARSSFWDRFTVPFAELVRWLLDDIVHQARAEPHQPPGVLAGFRDVIAVDATVVKLHDALASTWRGTRRNSSKAALKVHAWVRAFTGELLKYRITADAHGDGRAFGIDHALRGCLVLLDKGYSSPSLWRRIGSVGGYVLTRLPLDRNPMIVAENRRHRGRARKAVGRPLRDALEGLQRRLLDVDGAFRCHVRRYGRDKGRFVTETFRVVAVRRRNGTYEVFVTNAPPELLPADAVAATYRLRWEVETFFKTSKSGSALDELPSQKPEIVLALVYASLLRATAAMQALARFRREVADRIGKLVNPGQWVKWWNRQLNALTHQLVGPSAALAELELARMLADPHVARVTNRERFRAVGYSA